MLMMARTELVMSAAVVCGVAWSVPSDYWSLSHIGSDLVLYLFAALAYGVLALSRQRFNSKSMPGKISSKDLCSDLDLDREPCFQHVGDWSAHEESELIVIEQPKEGKVDVLELPSHDEGEPVIVEEPKELQFDVSVHVALMQKYALERSISGTMRTFRTIQRSGVPLNSLMYNTVLRAWINCGNVQAAEDWMEEMLDAGMADERSFNILIKAW